LQRAVPKEVRNKFKEAEKNLERFEQMEREIRPFVKKKPLILTSRFDKWEVEGADLSWKP